jgi:phenylpropionate dioxygenase-like ring-hydroxylating dioxygenase large terminal subunit
MGISDRRPKPSVQDVFATDTNPAPSVMRNESPADGWPTDDVSAERYFSKEWHDREVENVWHKCWQLACREEEIPNVGDHIVYEIVHDSLIVVRTSPTEIRAYVNSCLHRGTLLRTEGGCVQSFRCPFHAWTWNLDGKLVNMHQDWDLSHVNADDMNLPQAQVGTWGGFVFINFDENCEPLTSYLENLPEHFDSFDLDKRYKAAHVAKIMPCNWKLAMEAFIEAYHVAIAHPQVLAYYGDSNTQYDVWPGIRHVSRMISVQGVPSPALTGIDPNRTIEEMRRDVPFFAGKPIELAEGDSARAKLAERAREKDFAFYWFRHVVIVGHRIT